MNPRKLEHGFRMISAGIPLLYLESRRLVVFQLSGFYCRVLGFRVYDPCILKGN